MKGRLTPTASFGLGPGEQTPDLSLCPPLSLALVPTFTAPAATILPPKCVFRRQFVTPHAVGSHGGVGGSLVLDCVLLVCDGYKMGRANTLLIVAKVVQF